MAIVALPSRIAVSQLRTQTVTGRQARRSTVQVVRATSEPQDTASPSQEIEGPVVFFQGKAYSEAEFEAQKAAGTLTPVEESFPIDYESVPMTLGDIMAFSGPIPEIVNGRLAMLAFVAALGAELATGESVLKQFADEPTAIILTFITFAAASLIAIVNGASKNESFGPFKAEAEMLNGRAAMIGFAALLIIEGIKGSALF